MDWIGLGWKRLVRICETLANKFWMNVICKKKLSLIPPVITSWLNISERYLGLAKSNKFNGKIQTTIGVKFISPGFASAVIFLLINLENIWGNIFIRFSLFSQHFKFVLIDRSICAEIEIFGVSREFLFQSILKSRKK